MSEQTQQNNESKEGKEEKEIPQENKENKEDTKEEKNENKQQNKEDKKENIKENEEEKSEEEDKEKSESSKGSDSESEGSEESKESKKSKEKKSEENEEDDDEDDDEDIDDDDDNEGNSEESSDNDKQKDPYHGYLNSKTEYKNFFSNICTKDFVYGFKQNKFYKIIDYKNLSGDRRAQIYQFELKEIKTENKVNQKSNIKLKKNIQYMASIYGKAIENEINTKEENIKGQDMKDKDNNNDKNISEIQNNEKTEETKNKDNKDIPDKNEEVKIEESKEIKTEEKKEVKTEENSAEKEEQKSSKKTNKNQEDKKKENDKNAEKKSKNKNKNKPKNSNMTVVIKDLTEYTFFQKIRVVYLNALNNPEVFDLKININTTIKDILNQFAALYHYKLDRYSDKIPVCIFINGKMHSISNKTRSKYFIPTRFDYKNDYILILEKQSTKLKEYDVPTYNNEINLRGAVIPHVVYNSLYNFEVDSFIISKNLTFLDCQIYELKKNISIRQFTDNERTIKQKLKGFLDLNWKEKCTYVTSFKSVKAQKSKDNYRANLFELNRKFLLLQGKMYIFLIKSSNKKIYTFYGKDISTDGIYIVSRNDKSLINGFRAKAISDFKANP